MLTDTPGPSSPSATWPIQINIEQEDDSNYNKLGTAEPDFLSQTGMVKIREQSSLQETARREPVVYPIENQDVSRVDQVAKVTATLSSLYPDITSNQFAYHPMSNSGGHTLTQRGSPDDQPAQSVRTLQRGRSSLTRGRRIASRGFSRGMSHTSQMNASVRRHQAIESSSSRWSGPNSISSSNTSYQGE